MSMFMNPPPFNWIDITQGTAPWGLLAAGIIVMLLLVYHLHSTQFGGGVAVGKIVEFNNEDINNTTQDYLLLVC